MKKVLMFHFVGCPYCRAAENWLREVVTEHPELGSVPVEKIDENRHPEIADRYDYWYVPTFYIDGKKAHEGACSREIVEHVLREALDG